MTVRRGPPGVRLNRYFLLAAGPRRVKVVVHFIALPLVATHLHSLITIFWAHVDETSLTAAGHVPELPPPLRRTSLDTGRTACVKSSPLFFDDAISLNDPHFTPSSTSRLGTPPATAGRHSPPRLLGLPATVDVFLNVSCMELPGRDRLRIP